MKSIIDLVPEDWNTKPLKNFSTTYSGGTPLRSNEYFYSGDINWVKSSELKDKYLYETEEHINEDAIKNSSTRFIDPNVILFAMYGATAGDLCILKTKSTSNQAILAVPINRGKIDLEYLYYYLKYKTEKLKYITQGGGQPNLSKGIVDKVPISHPENPAEQTAIATLLSKVDEAIAATQNSIKAAEKLKKALMQNLLTGKLKPDGTWRTEDEFYDHEKFGKVPKGWEIDKFKNKVKVQYGKSQKDIVSENGHIPIYGTGGIIEYGTSALCEKESILIGRKGTLDKPYYINEPFWAVDTTYYVESFDNGNMQFLFYLLQRLNLKSLNEATGVPSLTRRTLNRQILLFPGIEEQNEIAFQIQKYEKINESKQTKIQTLQRLKKSLMQNLLTGKVRLPQEFVKQFENVVAEPALLEIEM